MHGDVEGDGLGSRVESSWDGLGWNMCMFRIVDANSLVGGHS